MNPTASVSTLLLLSVLCSVVEAATVAYWRFEPGSLEADSAGSNMLSNSGVISSSDTYAFAPGNGSASLSGTQRVFQTAQPLDLSEFSDLTIEYFIKTSDTDGGIIFDQDSAVNRGTPGAIASGILSNKVEAFQRGTDGIYLEEAYPRATNGKSSVTNGKWHHVAMIVDGSELDPDRLRLYVDGRELGRTNISYGPHGMPQFLNEFLYIGSGGNTRLKYAGLLDELRISDSILAPSEFLFVPIPEPSSLSLFLTATLLCYPRRCGPFSCKSAAGTAIAV